MVTREELNRLDEKEILIQLRMAVAVLEERTAYIPKATAKMTKDIEALKNENRWIKKLVFTATPLGPILAGVGALVTRFVG